MINRSAVLAAAFAASVLAAPVHAQDGLNAPAAGPRWTGDVNLLLAGKRLNRNDWEPNERQGEIGLLTDFARKEWPLAIAADLLVSGSHANVSSGGYTERFGSTSELDLGARKIWRPGPHVRPYLGFGLALITGELEYRGPAGTARDRDDGSGLWLGGGLSWTLGTAFNLGADARLSTARAKLFGRDRNSGGLHLGLLLGYHWGG